jgi:hypothetical protein
VAVKLNRLGNEIHFAEKRSSSTGCTAREELSEIRFGAQMKGLLPLVSLLGHFALQVPMLIISFIHLQSG